MKRPVRLAGLALVCGLAACGGGSPAAPGGTSPAAPAGSSAPPPSAKPASAAPSQAASAAARAGAVQVKGSYVTTSTSASVLWVAKEAGMFARNGLDVTLTSVQATGTIAALMAGETQFASSGPAEVAAADLQGASVVMVAEGAPLATYSLFTDRKFKSVPELAGQSIGVTAIGVGGDLAAHLYLRKFDVEDKVKTVATGGSSATILAAMDRGVVAGGMLIPPVTIQAERAGYAELVNGVKLGVPLSQGSLVMTRGFLRERPDVANRLIKGYLDTWKYLNDPANKASVVKIFEQYTKTETADAEMAYNVMLPQWQSEPVPYLSDPGIQNVITFLADPKARDADPKQFYDNSFLKAIASQAGS